MNSPLPPPPPESPKGQQGLSPVFGLHARLASCSGYLRLSLKDAFDFSLFNFHSLVSLSC